MIEQYEDMALKELIEAQVEAQEEYMELKRQAAEAYEKVEFLRKTVLPDRLNEMGITTATFPGVGRVSMRTDAYVTTKKGMKYDLMDWLRKHGAESLITDTVNASTLKAFIKEQAQEGNEIPDEELINYQPYQYTTVTKVKK